MLGNHNWRMYLYRKTQLEETFVKKTQLEGVLVRKTQLEDTFV